MLVSVVQQSRSAICIPISPYPLPLEPPSHPPYPMSLSHCKALSWSPCAMLLLPTSYFTFGNVYMSMLLSLCPSFPLPPHVLKSILYVCVFIPALPLGWSVLFFFKLINLFIYFWLRWVFVAARGLSLVAASGGYSSLQCAGFLLQWLLLLRSMGSRHAGFSSCGTWAQ